MPISYDGKDWDFGDLVEHIKATKPEIESPGGYVKEIEKKQHGESYCIKCNKTKEFWVNESAGKKMCTQCGNTERWEKPRSLESFVKVILDESKYEKVTGKKLSIEVDESKGTTYQGFIDKSMSYYKKKFASESVGMFYGMPQTSGVKQIKGLLAYAGVSLNNRLYLPEELSKGHEMTVPLLLNHSSTAGAEAEVQTLPSEYRTGLEQGRDIKVGEVKLHWDPAKLTLSYEGYVDNEYFIKEINEGKMGVSLGMVYDSNSPRICNEQCYTMIKGAEFREVSLVYHPGFPIVTIESNEALLKKKALEAISIEQNPHHDTQGKFSSDGNRDLQTLQKAKDIEKNPENIKIIDQLIEKEKQKQSKEGEEKPHKFLSEYGFAKDSDPEKYNSECQSCGEPNSSKLHTITEGQDNTSPNMADMQSPFHDNGIANPKIDENNDEIPEEKKAQGESKDPNINVLNTNIVENTHENYMSNTNKTKANEDAISMTVAPADPGTVNPSGDLPAKGVPYDQCGDGQIWSASQQKCIPADTGSSTARGPPSTVKPISVPTAESNSNADRRSEYAATRESLRKEEADEAERALQLAEQRVRAKELFNREKQADAQARELRGRIINAKENAQRKAIISSTKPVQTPGTVKVDAYEASHTSAAQWLTKVIAEEDVSMSKIWKVDKEAFVENPELKKIKTLDANFGDVFTPFNQYVTESKVKASEAVTGPPSTAFMRIMSEQVVVMPGGKVVTPIRQFCETKILPPGTNQAQFYDFGGVTFSSITEDGTTKVSESSPIIRAQQLTASPIGTMVTIGYTQTETSPVDLIAALNRAYALESVNQESIAVLNTAYNTDSGSSGDATTVKAIGGGSKTGFWVDGSTGAQITADASGLGKLSFDGLKAAKGVIQDQGFDDSNLICYTTGKAIRDLIDDPNLDTYIGFSKPAIITEGVVERVAGVNLVRTSALAAGSQANSSRSVLFVPGIAFAIASGRDLTMEAQRRNEIQSIFVTGTQRIASAVRTVEATCRLSHL